LALLGVDDAKNGLKITTEVLSIKVTHPINGSNKWMGDLKE
jgi:hypothetical protein